jgi:hypothetical protein
MMEWLLQILVDTVSIAKPALKIPSVRQAGGTRSKTRLITAQIGRDKDLTDIWKIALFK